MADVALMQSGRRVRWQDEGPTIRAATDFLDRFAVVDFATRRTRRDIAKSARLRRALTYAVPGNWVAIDAVDAAPDADLTILPGQYEAPSLVLTAASG
jgi:hypothetical protein